MCTRVTEYLNLFSLAEKDVEDAERSGKNWQDYLQEVSVCFASEGFIVHLFNQNDLASR